MRDYEALHEDGTRTKVADLPTWVLHEYLRRGITLKDEGGNVTTHDVEERIQLEIFIRERGLRNVSS